MAKKLLVFLAIIACPFFAAAQISGNVVDNSGQSLPGVNVAAPGGETVATDFDGNFTINAPAGTQLTFTMIGYTTITGIAAQGMKVTMQEETNKLQEVVVIGYGTKKAGAVTGSVAQVKAADIVRTPSQSPIQAIQGKAAGVNITATDEPGALPTIRIRGIGTILGGREPLYIVDGVEEDQARVNPSDIATIDILKDASSLAIYGQKGANGVIIITTKRGKSGELKVNYDTYYGQKFIQHKVKMADSFRYAYYNNSALGNPNYFSSSQPYNTDWLDEITGAGEMTSHNLSLSGGNDSATYYFAANNYKEEGILNGTQFERTTVSSRNDFKFLDGKVKISPNINAAITHNTDKPNSAFTTAYKQSPIVPVKFANGRWGVPLRNPDTGLIDINGSDRFNNVGNPVADLYYTHDQARELDLFGSVAAEISLFKWLKYTSNFGASYVRQKSFNFVPTADIYLSENPTKDLAFYESTFGVNPIVYNSLTQSRVEDYKWNWDNYFTFDRDFGKHSVTATLGMSRTTSNDHDVLSGTRKNVPAQSNYWTLNFSDFNTETAPNAVVDNSQTTPVVSIAYFARAEYGYNDKYLLTAVIRREGISAFQSGKRWANFPAVSGGWVISNESFMGRQKFFDYLKLRGGYGEVGNGRTVNATNDVIFRSGANYALGESNTILAGSYIPYAVDKNLTWETMREVDFGLDFRILDNRLSGTLEAYRRRSDNLIVQIDAPTGTSEDRVTVNAGQVVNKGVEASFRWDGKVNDNLTYYVSGNYAFNDNALTHVSNALFATYTGGELGNGAYTKQVVIGAPLGSFYVYDTNGYNTSGAFNYSSQRVVAGTYIPKYTYGLTLGANWKHFDFSADLYGVGGNKVYNGKKAQRFGNENVEYDYLNSFWTPSTPNAANPAPFNEIPLPSTYYVEDASYLRVNNITIGYTLPKLIRQISRIRVYATALNPFVFTKYSGYSPEINGDGDPMGTAGIELDAYPTNKTFLFGLNVSL